jgi:hypothetical protein
MTKCTCTYDVQCDACGDAEMLADHETERRMAAHYEGAGRFDQCWAENQADLEFHDSLFPDGYK